MPPWFQVAGFASGAITLLFLMGLSVASTLGHSIPDNGRYLIAAVLSLGGALAFAFIGGTAIASGKVPIAKSSALTFSVTGGIGVFVVLMLVSYWTFAAPVLGGLDKPALPGPEGKLQPSTATSIVINDNRCQGSAASGGMASVDCSINKVVNSFPEDAAEKDDLRKRLQEAERLLREAASRLSSMTGTNVNSRGYFEGLLREAGSNGTVQAQAESLTSTIAIARALHAEVMATPSPQRAKDLARTVNLQSAATALPTRPILVTAGAAEAHIRIVSANFGQTCGAELYPAAEITKEFATRCDRLRSCVVDASWILPRFGDRTKACNKDLVVKYECIAAGKVREGELTTSPSATWTVQQIHCPSLWPTT